MNGIEQQPAAGEALQEDGVRGSRSAARLAAVQALYQFEMALDSPAEDIVSEHLAYRIGKDIEGIPLVDADRDFFRDLVMGSIARGTEIDRMIGERLASGWRMERLDLTVKSILRLGAYELLARPDIPTAVVINEYLDIAHAFFEGAEAGFVNGLLDRLAKDLRSSAPA